MKIITITLALLLLAGTEQGALAQLHIPNNNPVDAGSSPSSLSPEQREQMASSLMTQGMKAQMGENGKPDYRAAWNYYHAAFEAGSSEGAEAIANLYMQGLGVNANANEADKWLTVALGMGSVLSADALGDSFLVGRGVKQDIDKAFDLYQKAARAGNLNSQIKVSGMYLKGVGTQKNELSGFFWIKVANNNPEARARFRNLEETSNKVGDGIDKSIRQDIEKKALAFVPVPLEKQPK